LKRAESTSLVPTKPGLPPTGLGGGVRVLITGPQRFERRVLFAIDEEPAEITRRVKETLDE
jgi:hypothetical protein